MHPTPSSPSASSRSGSIHRFSSEYDGWWIRSGVPRSREDRGGLARLLGRVGRDADVQRLALADGAVERAHRLLERRRRVEPVRVEDVDVVEPEPREALVEAREQVLARAPVAVRARPHVVAGLRRDDQLVAVGPEVVAQQPAEVLLRRAVRRAVVVREVEVRDAEVEGAAHDRPARLDRVDAAEVVPQPERDRGQREPAAAAAVVAHLGRSDLLRQRMVIGDVLSRGRRPSHEPSRFAGGPGPGREASRTIVAKRSAPEVSPCSPQALSTEVLS